MKLLSDAERDRRAILQRHVGRRGGRGDAWDLRLRDHVVDHEPGVGAALGRDPVADVLPGGGLGRVAPEEEDRHGDGRGEECDGGDDGGEETHVDYSLSSGNRITVW